VVPPKGARDASHSEWLARVIESEIVPRLLMHSVASRHSDGVCLLRWRPSSDDVNEFANLLISHDTALALAYVQSWRQQGAALKTLYVELLAKTPAQLRRLRGDRRLGLTRHALARYRLMRVVRALRHESADAEFTAATP
jgi:hypothetical protein